MKLLCTKDFTDETLEELWFKKWHQYEVCSFDGGVSEKKSVVRLIGEEGECELYLYEFEQCFDIGLIEEECIAEQKKDAAPKRGRGRPKGSKNTPKIKVPTSTIGKYTLENHEMLEALWPKGSK